MSWNFSDCDILLSKSIEKTSIKRERERLFFYLAMYVGEDWECVGEVWEAMWEKERLKCSKETKMKTGKCTLGHRFSKPAIQRSTSNAVIGTL